MFIGNQFFRTGRNNSRQREPRIKSGNYVKISPRGSIEVGLAEEVGQDPLRLQIKQKGIVYHADGTTEKFDY